MKDRVKTRTKPLLGALVGRVRRHAASVSGVLVDSSGSHGESRGAVSTPLLGADSSAWSSTSSEAAAAAAVVAGTPAAVPPRSPNPPCESSSLAEPAPAPPDELVGSILDGSYRVVKRLGAGGMAVVYEAVELSLNRRVAIKVLNQHFRSNADYRARFRNEATIAARIEHPNLVWIYQCRVEPDGLPYIVMELLRGRDLREELKLVGEMNWRRAARIVIQLCTALDAAHRRNVIHRDVKPANCFLCSHEDSGTADGLDQPDQLKLLDLGIAKLSGDIESFELTSPKTKEGHVLGTWPYMAPEQLTQQPVFQTDLYAVGAVLYRLITGRHPIERQGSNDLEYQTRIIFELPRPPTDFVPDLPSELDELILSALAKSTDERPKSALVVRGALEKILATDAARGGLSETRPPLQVLFYIVTALGSLSLVGALTMLIGITGVVHGRAIPEIPGSSSSRATQSATGVAVDKGGSAEKLSDALNILGAGLTGGTTTELDMNSGTGTTTGGAEPADDRATTTAGAHPRRMTARTPTMPKVVGAGDLQLLKMAIRRAKRKIEPCELNPFSKTLAVVMTVELTGGGRGASVKSATVTKALRDGKPLPLEQLRREVECLDKELQGLGVPGVEIGGIFEGIRVSVR